MKYAILLILIIGFLSAPTLRSLAVAGSQNGVNISTPLTGQCVADVFSKKYLSPINANPVVYQCEYTCLNNLNQSDKLTVVHNFFHSSSDLDEMSKLVCRGVHIEMIEKNGYQDSLVSAEAFWSQTADDIKFRQWARHYQLQLPISAQQKLDTDLKKNLQILIREYAYIDTKTFPEYAEALSIFKTIIDDPTHGPEILKNLLKMIAGNATANTKGEELVMINLKSLAPELVNLSRVE